MNVSQSCNLKLYSSVRYIAWLEQGIIIHNKAKYDLQVLEYIFDRNLSSTLQFPYYSFCHKYQVISHYMLVVWLSFCKLEHFLASIAKSNVHSENKDLIYLAT
jgi:hypothetical protein